MPDFIHVKKWTRAPSFVRYAHYFTVRDCYYLEKFNQIFINNYVIEFNNLMLFSVTTST